MNTLSSLLSWIGNTIGANPNTLATTSKKIVGSINELHGRIGTVNDRITSALMRQTITVTAASTTAGTIVSIDCVRCGNVVTVSIAFRNTAAIASGGNVCQCTLSSSLPRPSIYVTGGSYYGGHAITGGLTAERSFVARNASSSNVTIGATSTSTISFTYITQD